VLVLQLLLLPSRQLLHDLLDTDTLELSKTRSKAEKKEE
jgi:hypothetical protein